MKKIIHKLIDVSHKLKSILESIFNVSERKKKKLILFIVPGYNFVNGGIIAIHLMKEISEKLLDTHEIAIKISKYPITRNSNPFFSKYTLFENNNYIFEFESIIRTYKNIDNIVLHIPELQVKDFLFTFENKWDEKSKFWWNKIKHKQINILNFNIEYMPSEDQLVGLKNHCSFLTQSTAHKKYSTKEFLNKYNIPLFYISTAINSNMFNRINVQNKKKIICYSPDKYEDKQNILNFLIKNLPDFRFMEIKSMSYKTYKKIIEQCKYMITFGEGLDGYFVETIFSGGISFSRFNTNFFTDDFSVFPNVISNENSIASEILNQIKIYEIHANLYSNLNEQLYKHLEQYYSLDIFSKNLNEFYCNSKLLIAN